MTWSYEDADAGYMLSTLVDPWLLYPIMAGLKKPRYALTWPRWGNVLGVMVKLKDEVSGGVFPDGRIRKPLTPRDRERLAQAEEVCRTILVRAGAEPSSLFSTPLRGTHPSGTVRIGTHVDRDLATPVRGLFVCDASVFPEALDRPTVLTIVALAKRLAKHLAPGQRRDSRRAPRSPRRPPAGRPRRDADAAPATGASLGRAGPAGPREARRPPRPRPRRQQDAQARVPHGGRAAAGSEEGRDLRRAPVEPRPAHRRRGEPAGDGGAPPVLRAPPEEPDRQPAAQRAPGRPDALLPAHVEEATPAVARGDDSPRPAPRPPARRAPLLHPGGRAHLARGARLRAGRRRDRRAGAGPRPRRRPPRRGRRVRGDARRSSRGPAPLRLPPPPSRHRRREALEGLSHLRRAPRDRGVRPSRRVIRV